MGTALDLIGDWLAPAVVRATLEGTLVAAPVWLLCRFVPTLPAAARAWLWWGVSMKLVLATFGAPAYAVAAFPASWSPVLPQVLAVPAAPDDKLRTASDPVRQTDAARETTATAIGTPATAPERLAPASAPSRAPMSWRQGSWRQGLGLLWLAGVIVHLLLLARDGRRLRTILRRTVAPAPCLAAEHAELATRLGLRRVPRVRESPDVVVPQVVGAIHPSVLLPLGTSQRLSQPEREMVLCHELVHVRRRDLALAWMPALASRLLVWHPLAWLATREYLLAREAACDHAVLRTLRTEPHDYGRLLVRIGVGPAAAGVVAAGASPTFRLLRRRLGMLQHHSSPSSRHLWLASVAAALIASLVPLRLVAARGESNYTTDTAAWAASERADVREARDEQPNRDRRPSTSRASWVFLYGDRDSSTMNGSWEDVEEAKRLRGNPLRPFLYFRKDGRAYTIDDPGTLKAVETIFGPMEALGRQQGALGEKQGALGEQQGRLGERQGELGVRQGELGMRQGEMSGRMAAAQADALAAEAERLRGRAAESEVRELQRASRVRTQEVERQMRELSERQAALGEEQAALGREQSKLGAEQGRLGDEQARLGERQREASERADRELAALVERAIAQGTAREVK